MYKKVELPKEGYVGMEKEVAELWKEKDIVKKNFNKNEGKKYFMFYDGPPTANGMPHVGHIETRVMKDIIPRYKVMKGYYVPRKAGWDTHGLPVELEIEKKLGISGKEQIEDYGVEKFVKECKDSVFQYVHIWEKMTNQVGYWVDMEHPYVTYHNDYIESVWWALKELWKKGLLYEGHKVMPYCPRCGTALSSHEVAQGYKDVKDLTCIAKFKVKGKENTYILAWTTTPWTLPSNLALCVNKTYTYAEVKVNAGTEEEPKYENYILAKDLISSVLKDKEYELVKEFKGEELLGTEYEQLMPFAKQEGKAFVVIHGDYVTLTDGTGIVHIAPAYGEDDSLVAKQNDIAFVNLVDKSGKFVKEVEPWAGRFVRDCNEDICKWLNEQNKLFSKEKHLHSYPHCWRCKKPIIFRATKQWFASIDKFRADSLKAIKNVKWVPAWGEDRISKMIEERNDWCISRQRTWGVPLPIFYCKNCEKEYVTDSSMEKVINLVKEHGTNCWFDMDVKDLLPADAKCPECGCKEFTKELDIMDVWFDSGSTHQSCLAQRGLPKADLYLEGADQYRGWFQSSLLTSIAVTGDAPYKEVLTHGWTVDAQGRQMHKSLGNGIDPQEVIDQYGADILRLWALSSDYQSDVRLSKEILKQVSEVYRKIRNTARYILGNIHDFDVNKPVAYEDLQEIDKWALTRLNNLISECTKSYDAYDFNKAYQAINTFCVLDMSNFYLDIIKDRLYTAKPESTERRAAQTTMYEILQALVKIIAPMASFTAEEIWKYMPHKDGENTESVMLSYYPEVNEKYEDKELEAKWDKILKIKEAVAKKLEEARAEKVIGHSLNAKVIISAEGEEYKFLNDNKELLKDVFIVSGLDLVEGTSEIKVQVAEGEKCERCWKYDVTVGQDKENPTICHRCSEALK